MDLWRAVLASGPVPAAPGLETRFRPWLVTERRVPEEKGALVATSHPLGSALAFPDSRLSFAPPLAAKNSEFDPAAASGSHTRDASPDLQGLGGLVVGVLSPPASPLPLSIPWAWGNAELVQSPGPGFCPRWNRSLDVSQSLAYRHLQVVGQHSRRQITQHWASLRVLSSSQQVWQTAMPAPGRTSPTATVPRSPSSASSPRSPGTPGSEKVASPLECSICFSGYDNIFKTPKELSCTHVFCLECLARLAAAQPTGRPGSEAVPCPFCRQPTAVPAAGAPALRTSRQLQARMPAHLRREEPVWLEGTKLCCRPPPSTPGLPAPGFVCVDVGLSKPAEPTAPTPTPTPGPTRRQGRLARCWARCGDWRRVALVTALLLVLFCVVLWPVQCALKTGNLRCLPRPSAAITTAAAFSPGPLADN
ncbi:RING finger protein 223 [Ursus arctos]|uniref:RING finger protein 223 n=1 Tax=Ursus arctos TaxID=9644 RepID=UPI001CF89CB9|nr:RING finger protein 223 [Ursus arctos]